MSVINQGEELVRQMRRAKELTGATVKEITVSSPTEQSKTVYIPTPLRITEPVQEYPRIKDEYGNVFIQLDLPGFCKDSVKVFLNPQNVLTIWADDDEHIIELSRNERMDRVVMQHGLMKIHIVNNVGEQLEVFET